MKPQATLTIDLDYWNGHTLPFAWLEQVFEIAPNKSLVINHEQILNHINNLNYTHLVSIDWHSDLGGYKATQDFERMAGRTPDFQQLPELNCGTWVDHVTWRNTAEFTWIHPNEECAVLGGSGRCEGDDSDAFELAGSRWKRSEHRLGGLKPKLPPYHYQAVNICLSEDYLINSIDKQVATIDWFDTMDQKYDLLSLSDSGFVAKYLNKRKRQLAMT